MSDAITYESIKNERGRGKPAGQGVSLGHYLKYHMDGDTYVACENLNFCWSRPELRELVDMWNVGVPIDYIAKHFDRADEECAICLMDLAMAGVIQYRPGGLWGKTPETIYHLTNDEGGKNPAR